MDTLPVPVPNHRGSGWTLWREVYGTFIGVLPLVILLGGAAFQVIRDNDRNQIKITYLERENVRIEAMVKGARDETEKARSELIIELRRIGTQIEGLQQQVALINGRTKL